MGCGLCNCVGGLVLGIFRWGIFVVNVLNLLFGITVFFIGIAILAKWEIDGLESIANDDLVGAFFLIAGIVSVTIAIVGCCGTLKGSPTLMKIYAVVMFINCALSFVSGILTLIGSDVVAAGVVSIVIALLELTAGVFSILLAKRFKKRRLEEMTDAVRRAQTA